METSIHNISNYVYLDFAILSKHISIGKVQLLVHKCEDIEKRKNPQLLIDDVIQYFKEQNKQYEDVVLNAYFISETIPLTIKND